ncbi:SPAG5 protein, partial [Rhagologus leucostigma]|nr:SPAG5 protein [Rhagologus leucostigma]
DGSAAPLHCQGTPEGAESPAAVPPEQSPPGLPPIEASGLEPAGSEATVTPVTSPESTLGAVSWMLPLVWLEKTLNTSFLVESLRHSLPLRKPQQDASSSVAPVPTVVTGTSTTPVPTTVTGTSMTPTTTPVPTTAVGTTMTPVPTMATGTSMTPVLSMAAGTFMTPRDVLERSMNTSRGSLPCAKDSAAETDSLLWHCPREQLKTLPRAELEGRLESTLIIIEALSLQLRDWQESQRLRPGVGPAKQRDALTQTDITHPEGVREEISRQLCLELRRKREAVQQQWGAERDLQRELGAAGTVASTWSSQCPLFRDLADAAFRSLQDEQGALAQEVNSRISLCFPFALGFGRPVGTWCCPLPLQEHERAVVSQCQAVPESVPSKLQSCLEERDAIRQRVDE